MLYVTWNIFLRFHCLTAFLKHKISKATITETHKLDTNTLYYAHCIPLLSWQLLLAKLQSWEKSVLVCWRCCSSEYFISANQRMIPPPPAQRPVNCQLYNGNRNLWPTLGVVGSQVNLSRQTRISSTKKNREKYSNKVPADWGIKKTIQSRIILEVTLVSLTGPVCGQPFGQFRVLVTGRAVRLKKKGVSYLH